MFTPAQLILKGLAVCCGVVSLWVVPGTVIAQESTTHPVWLAQLSPEVEAAAQKAIQAEQQIQAGNWEAAITLLEQALPVFRKTFGSEHPGVQGLEYYLKGAKLAQAGNIEDAKAAFEQAINLFRQIQEARTNNHQTTSSQQSPELEEARQLHQQAYQLYEQGKYNEAIPLAERLLEIGQRLLGENHPYVATSLSNLAELYRLQGRYTEAEPLFIRELEMYQKLLGKEHPDVAQSLNNLANLYSSQGRYSEAEPLFIRALEMRQKLLGTEHPDVATSLNSLGELYTSQGRYNEAEPLVEQALEMRQKLLGTEHPHVAQSLNNLANLYTSQGRYTEAEPLYKQALEMYQKLSGTEHPHVAQSLNNLAGLFRLQGRYTEAEPLYKQALEMRQKLLGTEHPDVAQSLNHLANLYTSQGRYSEAEPLVEQVLEIRQRLLGENHLDVARSMDRLASLYHLQGRYTEAEPLFQRSLAIREKALSTEHPDVASSLNNLADLYQDQGRYTEAEPLFQRSLVIREKALGTEHPDVASSLNSLGELYRKQGHYSQAEPLLQRSLAISEKALSTEDPNVAITLNNLAHLYLSQGRYSQAELFFQRSLAILEKALWTEHPDVATSLNNLAELFRLQGRYTEAEPLFQRSLAIREKALSTEHPDVAVSLNNLASLYDSQGRYSQAEPLYRQALEMYQKLLGTEHPLVATSLKNLAGLYESQGRYNEAEPLLIQALEMTQKLLGTEHPDVASSLNSLGELYRKQRRYSKAEPLLIQALEMDQKLLGTEHPSVAASLNNLANLYTSQGRYNQAEPLYRQALEMRQKLLGTEHPSVAQSLNNLTFLYHSQGDTTQAINFLSRGLNVEEQNLNVLLATGSERQKQDSMKTVLGTTYQSISLHLKDAPNNTEAARLALTTILRRKARILDVMTNDLQLLRENITPENQQLLSQFEAVQSQRANLLYNPPQDLPPEQFRQLMNDLAAEADKLEAELSLRSAEFRVETQAVEIENIKQFIPEDGVLVELILYQPFNAKANQWGELRYAAYILAADGQVNWVDLGEAEPIDQKVRLFRRDLRNKSASVKHSARELDEVVMRPIREMLGDKTHILISPDGQLNLIPFAALVDENNEYLVRNYLFTYLSTGRDLLRLQLNAPSRQDPVMLANPNYDEPGDVTGVQLASTSPRVVGESGMRSNQRSTDLATLTFSPLEGTQLEADTILPLIPNLQLFTGSQATENLLYKLQAPQILHLATHGFFLEDIDCIPTTGTRSLREGTIIFIPNPDFLPECKPTPRNTENPLLRSGLALAGFNVRQSGEEDGVLTASEVTRLRLYGTKLVVLSACETGLGSLANGEGVYGLRRAFVKSGAESQLMSLWQVDDYGTSELISLYYQRIKRGEGRSIAMRQIQLDLLEEPFYEHPYYWASFIFTGDWRSMEGF
ncbi:tetratricopeptide repeat protein [Limnoraphis robusta]|uniref:Tetratricopeptide repeat protein n=1 Tax=Limnoraphis robusta CCNP1315 TaxID=3110306 RepID=A0ABU5TR10_9CYAN|nr:tetratricopeptide repeat protein [Limnoraphis robusta]MEA5517358.1 tetratricopeptide repeat protein [Limnoraphis robusta CCNP1315]MEA5546053.1 tetratricopeptide repeat protein [Limnoraphis robusta CCNP1324]